MYLLVCKNAPENLYTMHYVVGELSVVSSGLMFHAYCAVSLCSAVHPVDDLWFGNIWLPWKPTEKATCEGCILGIVVFTTFREPPRVELYEQWNIFSSSRFWAAKVSLWKIKYKKHHRDESAYRSVQSIGMFKLIPHKMNIFFSFLTEFRLRQHSPFRSATSSAQTVLVGYKLFWNVLPLGRNTGQFDEL